MLTIIHEERVAVAGLQKQGRDAERWISDSGATARRRRLSQQTSPTSIHTPATASGIREGTGKGADGSTGVWWTATPRGRRSEDIKAGELAPRRQNQWRQRLLLRYHCVYSSIYEMGRGRPSDKVHIDKNRERQRVQNNTLNIQQNKRTDS